MANEPLAYREAIAAAVQVLRPQVDVTTVAPPALDDVVGRQHAQVVICSVLTEAIRREVAYWVVLYPNAQAEAYLGRGGREEARDSLQLDDLLAIIDEAGRHLPIAGPGDPNTPAPGSGSWARTG